MNHAKLKRNSRVTSRKRGLLFHHAMHHFHDVTPIMLLFYESRPEKRVNHAITPIVFLFYESRHEKMANYAITPTAGGASLR